MVGLDNDRKIKITDFITNILIPVSYIAFVTIYWVIGILQYFHPTGIDNVE